MRALVEVEFIQPSWHQMLRALLPSINRDSSQKRTYMIDSLNNPTEE